MARPRTRSSCSASLAMAGRAVWARTAVSRSIAFRMSALAAEISAGVAQPGNW